MVRRVKNTTKAHLVEIKFHQYFRVSVGSAIVSWKLFGSASSCLFTGSHVNWFSFVIYGKTDSVENKKTCACESSDIVWLLSRFQGPQSYNTWGIKEQFRIAQKNCYVWKTKMVSFWKESSQKKSNCQTVKLFCVYNSLRNRSQGIVPRDISTLSRLGKTAIDNNKSS